MIFDTNQKSVKQMPLLPLRDIVVFPNMVVPLYVGRKKSVAALEHAMANGKEILLAAQKKSKNNDPQPEDIFDFACLGTVIQMLKLPDGTVKLLVEGKKRGKIDAYTQSDPFYMCSVAVIEDDKSSNVQAEALMRSVQDSFESYIKLNKKIPPEMLMSVAAIDNPSRLADTIAAHLSLKQNDKQGLLEMTNTMERLEKLYALMQGEIEILQVEKKIQSRVKKQMEKTQKDYYLNERMNAIQKELGEKDEFKAEMDELEKRIASKKMSKEATKRVLKEFKKLKMMSPMAAEATVVRNYIDWVLDLPWKKVSQDKLDIDKAQAKLDQDHFGLLKVKERILEYLAVQKRVKKIKGPILCFVGPPGVGKTSLAKSIAASMGRKFVRISVGGLRDEAEIRGHRRTYIGAMPGKLIQSLKKAGTNNPVFLIDEIDKMASDYRGDPSSAMLEVLDPEQNATFNDNYLDLDYDLSKVMFLATANSLQTIPRPLLDRMEVIEVSGYTEDEKVNIAKQYLIEKQQKASGIEASHMSLSDAALKKLIRRYTKEAGVRGLEREIASLCRKIAKKIDKEGEDHTVKIDPKILSDLLGAEKFKFGKAHEKETIGRTTGLAWTQLGGDLLDIEVSIMPGKGKLTLTGKLGDVMKESAQAAMSYVRSRAKALGLKNDFYSKIDVHVHVPEGGIPKDGPSAGITMATSLVSALLRIPVRNDVAMTGEITIAGRVLPIGGLKEKLLAAHRGGIKTILIPKENEKDLSEVPKDIQKDLDIHVMEHADEVLKKALVLDSVHQKDFLDDLESFYPAILLSDTDEPDEKAVH